MFRLRRGNAHVHHDHDSDAEQDCNSKNDHHDDNHHHATGGGEGGEEEVTSSPPIASSIATSSTSTSTAAMIRRKRIKRMNGSVNSSSSSSMKHRSSSLMKQWIKKLPLRRTETSAIFVLGIAGCIIAGFILFIILKLFTAMTGSNTNQYKNAYKHGHHGKNFQGMGGGVYKGPPLLHGGPVPNSGKRRGLLQQHEHQQQQHHPHGGGDDDDGSGDGDDSYEVLPWNNIYHIPEAHENVGDRSDAYARLRKEIDVILPIDTQRSISRLQELQRRDYMTGDLLGSRSYEINVIGNDNGPSSPEPYDIFNCPDIPPHNYPYEWKLVDEVLHAWSADDINIPKRIHQGLCVFDYIKDYNKAMRYRNDELPFIVIGDPNVARTVERWAIPGYMEELMGYSIRHRAEYNTNNHFLYHQPPPRPKRDRRGRGHGRRVAPGGGDPSRDEPEGLQDLYGRPAKLQRAGTMPDEIRITYTEWLSHANVTGPVGPNDEHWYFRLIGCGYMGADGSCDAGSSEYLFDELPFFQPVDNLYLGQGEKQKGIHCRFGMKGVIAEVREQERRKTKCIQIATI
jgi:hypothetical protein